MMDILTEPTQATAVTPMRLKKPPLGWDSHHPSGEGPCIARHTPISTMAR